MLDFYCPAARLAVELDGATHDSEAANRRDARRDVWLAEHRVRVLRIANTDIEHHLEAVLIAIREAAVPTAPSRAR